MMDAWKRRPKHIAMVTNGRLNALKGRKTQGKLSVVKNRGWGVGSEVRNPRGNRGSLWSRSPEMMRKRGASMANRREWIESVRFPARKRQEATIAASHTVTIGCHFFSSVSGTGKSACFGFRTPSHFAKIAAAACGVVGSVRVPPAMPGPKTNSGTWRS